MEGWMALLKPTKETVEILAEERLMILFLKWGRKMLNAGELAEPRFSQFLELLYLCEKYKRRISTIIESCDYRNIRDKKGIDREESNIENSYWRANWGNANNNLNIWFISKKYLSLQR